MSGVATIELPRPRRLDAGTILLLARKEIRDALRNRWFIFYSAAFAVLATALSLLSLAGTETFGHAGYGRTAASLINLVVFIVPLMGLTTGAAAIAADREGRTLAYLLAQPVSRLEVVLGKYLGLAVCVMAAVALGFGIAAAVVARQQVDPGGFVRLVGLTFLLALAMLAVGMLVSTLCRRASTAVGAAIVVWLVLVLLGDLGLMGSTIIFRLQVQELLRLALLNPLQVYRMAAVGSIQASLDVLGPAGLYAVRTYGEALPALLAGLLGAWAVLPLAVTALLFVRRGDA